MDKVVRMSIADLLINLAAGWFAASLGALFLIDPTLLVKIGILFGNLSFGIISMFLAIWLRRLKK